MQRAAIATLAALILAAPAISPAHTAQWLVEVPAKGESVLTYAVRVLM